MDLSKMPKSQLAALDLQIAVMEEKGLNPDDILPEATVVTMVVAAVVVTVTGLMCAGQKRDIDSLSGFFDDLAGPDDPDDPNGPKNPFPIDPTIVSVISTDQPKTLDDLIACRTKLVRSIRG